MVKHQKQCYQRYPHPTNKLEDCTLQLDLGESPLTPSEIMMPWSAQRDIGSSAIVDVTPMHGLVPFANFNRETNPNSKDEQMILYQSISPKLQEDDTQGLSLQIVHHTARLPERTPCSLHQYNPGLATTRANMRATYPSPGRHIKRPALEMSESLVGQRSLNGSPTRFTSVSRQSLAMHDVLCIHQPPALADYSLQDALADEQQHKMYFYPQQMQQIYNPQPDLEWRYQYKPFIEGYSYRKESCPACTRAYSTCHALEAKADDLVHSSRPRNLAGVAIP